MMMQSMLGGMLACYVPLLETEMPSSSLPIVCKGLWSGTSKAPTEGLEDRNLITAKFYRIWQTLKDHASSSSGTTSVAIKALSKHFETNSRR